MLWWIFRKIWMSVEFLVNIFRRFAIDICLYLIRYMLLINVSRTQVTISKFLTFSSNLSLNLALPFCIGKTWCITSPLQSVLLRLSYLSHENNVWSTYVFSKFFFKVFETSDSFSLDDYISPPIPL